MFQTSIEQDGRVAASLEEGRPHATAAFEKGFQRLNLLRRIMPRAGEELLRLQMVVQRVLPAQTPQQAAQLTATAVGGDSMLGMELRRAGQRSTVLGCWQEKGELDELAAEIERLETDPALGQIMRIRERLRVMIPEQTNVEIRRWMSMALTPGDEIVTNRGERLV